MLTYLSETTAFLDHPPDQSSFEDKAGAEEVYFQIVDGHQPLGWMLEIEGVTQGAEAVFMFPENWAGPESFLQYAACQGALVIALDDGASPESLIVNLSIGLTGATELPELAEDQAGTIHAIIAVELDAGSKAICAFPDVCMTPPENDYIDWEAPNGIIGILVGVVADAGGSAWPDALVYADVWERSFEQITDDLTIEGPASMGDLLL